MKTYYVYILSSRHRGTLYIGVTSDLPQRVYEHKTKVVAGFTEKYAVDQLVYYECFEYPENAIKREKNLKAWRREWKTELIEEKNPLWRDLYEDIVG